MKRMPAIAAVLAMLFAGQCCAQKSTIDPNVRKPDAAIAAVASTPEPADYDVLKDPDKRMSRLITYSANHARLSSVLAEISSQSGVSIQCGKNKNDWQTRDLPVTIRANEVALGMLLRALACATHNVLRVEKVNNALTYRIIQDPALARQFSDYEQAASRYKKAVAAWNWDALQSLNDVPETQLRTYETDAAIAALRIGCGKKMAALLNALGPEYRERALGGEPVLLDSRTLPEPAKTAAVGMLGALDQLRSAYNRKYNSTPANGEASEAGMPISAEDLAKIPIVISMPESDHIGSWYCLQFTAIGHIGLGLAASPAEYLGPDSKVKRMSKAPDPPAIEENGLYDSLFTDIIEKRPKMFDAKADMDDLAGQTDLTCAAAMAEMAKRAGFSLVMEDWDYHKQNPLRPPHEWLRKSVQLDSLRHSDYSIKSNGRDKLIVATLRRGWAEKRRALAPASVIDPLTEKIKKEPIYLDDLLPVVLLTNLQWQDWIQGSKELDVITRHVPVLGDSLWQFFAMLTPQDRAQAASPAGLSLAGFDPSVVSELLAAYAKSREKQLIYSSYRPSLPAVSDAKDLARLVMRLKATESPFQGGGMARVSEGRPAPVGLDRVASYSLYVEGGEDGRTQYASTGGPMMLPFYSLKREAELLKSLVEGSPASPTTTGTLARPSGPQ